MFSFKSIIFNSLRAVAFSAAIVLSQSALAQETLYVYGPGGPAPAMKEAAVAFEKSTGVKVEVTGGPTPKWLDKAKIDADLIFSGSETMMTDFVYAMDGQLSHQQVTPLYLRPLSILVRPGNPKTHQARERPPQAWRESAGGEWRGSEWCLGRHGQSQG